MIITSGANFKATVTALNKAAMRGAPCAQPAQRGVRSVVFYQNI
jgi:hypothetical protein